MTTNNIVTLPTNKPAEEKTMVWLHDKKAVTTSLKVAEIFEKEHYNVLRDIKKLDCSKEFHALNFEGMSVDVTIGNGAVRKDPAFNMTKDGFVFLVMGYTGSKAAQFKEAYIAQFNLMEKQLYKLKHLARPKSPQDIFVANHKAACLLLKDKNQRLRYANELTLAETGFDVMAHALGYQSPVLKNLLNTTFGTRTIQQLLDSVYFQQEDHVQSAQLLLSQFITLKNGVLVIGNKCPLITDHYALKGVPTAFCKMAHFKGTGAVRSTFIPLY